MTATMVISLIRMLRLGPAVSLNGSPTVSPITAALCGSEPFPPWWPSSISFLALSHTPPALAIIKAIRTPVTSAPPRSPPRPATPSTNPVATGAVTASRPGRIISLMADRVEMATHRAESGSALPSSSPGMLRNCRRTSSIISLADRPTAFMVIAEKMNGSMPPTNMPMSTLGLVSSRLNCRGSNAATPPAWATVSAAVAWKVENRARAVRAADPMANPLPMAAVVLPTASRASVRSRTNGSQRLISAMPPALSATGP